MDEQKSDAETTKPRNFVSENKSKIDNFFNSNLSWFSLGLTLLAFGIFLFQIYFWLKNGFWLEVSLRDGFHYAGLDTGVTTHWAGIDSIIQYTFDLNISVFLIIISCTIFSLIDNFTMTEDKSIATIIFIGILLVVVGYSSLETITSQNDKPSPSLDKIENTATVDSKLSALSAKCILVIARTYNVPPAVLVGILRVKGGSIGEEIGPFPDGSFNLGPMRINSGVVEDVATYWKVEKNTVYKMIRDDYCVNIAVSAWILRKNLNETDNLTLAIAHYESKTPDLGYKFAKDVIRTMKEGGLILENQ